MRRPVAITICARSAFTVAAGLLAAFVLVTGALAWFTTTGSGRASATVGTLAAPSITSATVGAGSVTLSWSTVTPSSSGTVTYSVSRNGGSAGGTCPTATSPAAVTSCTDSGLSAGTYQYVVYAHWNSWTSQSTTRTATVTSGAADHLVLSAATTTPVAGAADNLTITAKDSAGNTVTAYTGAKSLTFTGANTIGSYHPTVTNSSGTAVNFGTPETITFISGVATTSGSSNGVMALYKAETVNIVVSDGTINNGAGLAVTVSAGSAASLILAARTATPTAGATDPLTITATDAFGNTATSYAGLKNLTFSGAGTSGAFVPTVTSTSGTAVSFGSGTAITFVGGVATVSGSSNGVMTLYKAESARIVVSDGTISNGSGLSVTVSAGTSVKLAFTQQPSSSTGGTAFATQPRVELEDQYGNTVAGDTSSVMLAITSGTGTSGATLTCAANPLAASGGVAAFTGCKIDLAGAGYSLTATDGALTPAISVSFDITVGPPVKLAFIQQPAGAVAGTPFTTQPRVAIQDAGGNTVTTNSSSVTLSITSGTGTSGAALTCTADPLAASGGIAAFAGCKIDLAGTAYTLTATDGSLTAATSTSFNVAFAGNVGETVLAASGANPTCNAGATCTTTSVTPASGSTVLILIQRGGSTTSSDAITSITGSSITAPIQTASLEYPTATGANYLFAWRATGTGVPGAITINFATGSNANPTLVDIVQVSNNNLSSPVAQSATASGVSGDASASLVSPSSANGEFVLVSFLANRSISIPAGFTQIDLTRTGSNGGQDFGVYFKSSAQAATTITSPSSGAGWGTIAIEVSHG